MANYLQSFSGLSSLNIQLVAKFSSSISLCQILGWSVLVRVDGLTYSLLGDVLPNLYNGTVNFTSIAITPTQTVFAARAGPMQVNLTFLNPIEVRFHSSVTFNCPHTHHIKPQNWVKQSIPFSYMAFTASTLDGASHSVQVYSDVSGGTNNRSSESVVSPQLRYRMELGGSNADDLVELDVQCRCHLPPCHTQVTGIIHRGDQPSGVGYSILCHEGRA